MPLRILLADDSMTAQKMGKDILASAGYEVTTVSNGAAAAKKLADKHDLYILDIFMPGYSGFELCEKLRASADHAKRPVLLTVGKMEPYNQVDVQRVKADGIIIKPFEASDLLAAIKKLMEAQAPPAAEASYEKTMIFRPPQVEEFKDPSYADWKSEAADAPEEMAPPAPVVMSREAASAPAFMLSDPDATVEILPTPAVTAFDDTVTFLAAPAAAPSTPLAAAAAAPAMDFGMGFPATAATELTPVETQSVENLIAAPSPSMDFGVPSMMEPEPVAAAPAQAPEHQVEFNSAPQAGPVKIVAESALESDENTNDISVSQDPSLVTDPTEIATAFVTKFGVENDVEEVAEAEKGFSDSRPPIEAAPASAEADDFEARVAAAMADFGDEPGAAPPPEVIAPVVEEMQMVSPVEEAVADSPAPEPSIPEPSIEDTQKIEAVVDEVTEEVAAAPAPTTSPEIDQALVEQMHAAFADLPVETSPMEEAQVIAAPPPPPAPVETAGHDLELASALARAVGAEPPVAAAAAAGATSSDASATAQVVSRVLERMLPAIMAELAKELEANKKQ